MDKLDRISKTLELGSNARIALFGGSFDPIHNGHIAIVEEALANYDFAAVHFITAKHSPVQGKTLNLDAEQRHQMVEMICVELQNKYPEIQFEAPRLELERQGTSYTQLTIKEYREQYPEVELYWIMGEDSFNSLPKWQNFEYILSNVKLIVYPRTVTLSGSEQSIELSEEIRQKALEIKFLDAALIPISSTEIRSIVLERREDKFKDLVPNRIKDLLIDCYSR